MNRTEAPNGGGDVVGSGPEKAANRVRIKDLGTGFSIPVLGIGAFRMGGLRERDPNNNDGANIRTLKTAIESGITHIDTAESYAAGWSERIVGKAIKGYSRRDLFVTSKVHRTHLGHDDVLRSVEGSLDRLGTDYLDLYLIHGPNDEVPIAETMSAMDALVNQGLIRYIGVSNFNTDRLHEAQQVSTNKIVTNQVNYNLAERDAEESGLLDYCRQNDVVLTAYRPVKVGEVPTEASTLLERLCNKYGATPAQIALNWITSQQNVVAISGMRDTSHLAENLRAVTWVMEPEDIELLRKYYPRQSTKDMFKIR